jgi:hypothetical protein
MIDTVKFKQVNTSFANFLILNPEDEKKEQ